MLEIEDEYGNTIQKAFSNRDNEFVYEVGKLLKEPQFDEDRWHETAKSSWKRRF